MAIITISRQLGSLGSEIAKSLKEELGYNFLDKELLEEELVNKYGIKQEKVKQYDEKKPAFWDMFYTDKDRYLYFLKTTMYEFAHKGHCVIMGRGGQVLFQDIPGSLHVRIIAPLKARFERIMEIYNGNKEIAEQVLQHCDHDRAGFHKFFFHANWEDPGLYDLTVNTRLLTVEAAAQIIKDAINASGIAGQQPEHNTQLTDLCLSQEVYTRIVYTEKVPIRFLNVVTNNCEVILRGGMNTEDDINKCEEIAANVTGVKKVENELHHIPTAYSRI